MTTNVTSTHARATAGFHFDPVVIAAGIQALLLFLVSFGYLSFIGLKGQNDVAVVMVVVYALGAVYTAYRTNRTLLAPVIELFKALLGLGAIYGLHLTNDQTGMLIVLITSVFSLFHQTQVIPLKKGTFSLVA